MTFLQQLLFMEIMNLASIIKSLVLSTAFPFVRKICLRKEHHRLSNS